MKKQLQDDLQRAHYSFVGEKKARNINTCSIFLTVICVVCVILCAYFVICQFEIFRSFILGFYNDNDRCKEERMCFTCDYFKSFPMVKVNVVPKSFPKRCCVAEEMLPEFLKQISENDIRDILDKENPLIVSGSTLESETKKPVAHLAPKKVIPDLYKADRMIILWLPPQDNDTFLKNGMILYLGRYLRIPVTGNYFFYSQVTFLESKELDSKITCNHYFVQHENNRTRDLKTSTSSSSSFGEFSDYLGATVFLQKGDLISVQTSQCEIALESYSTFMGAFMM